ncbi:hypothetical protein EBR21_15715 [bacterium]|nr:hypothetical protein [bacterium]
MNLYQGIECIDSAIARIDIQYDALSSAWNAYVVTLWKWMRPMPRAFLPGAFDRVLPWACARWILAIASILAHAVNRKELPFQFMQFS